MRYDILLPGSSHVPGVDEWAHQLDADGFRRILQGLDHLGFHAVLVSEHAGMPHRQVPRLGGYWQDPLAVMAFAAGVTRRLRMEPCVLVLPYHHPLRLAKMVATIDVLSGGRVGLSVGVGHARREFEALGVSFERRGALADEVLAALVTLWTEPEPVHRGEFFTIEGLAVEPRPVQRPRPPILVGGNSRPALRRAARYDGWQPMAMGLTPADLPPMLDYLCAQPEFAGKDHTFEVSWTGRVPGVELESSFAAAGPARLRAYRERHLEQMGGFDSLGISRLTVHAPPSISGVTEYLEFLHWFADEVGEFRTRAA